MFRFGILLLIHVVFCSTANAQASLEHVSARSCTAPCAAVAVIFIHGLTGSAETWVHSASGQSFPKMLADDPQVRDAIDVYVLNYESLWNSGPPIVEVTKAVSRQLDPLLKDMRYSKVVFVAHSLGGNIANEYLAHVALRFGHAALSRFRLVMTLGTPFKGSSLAGLAGLYGGNEQIRSLLDIRKNDFLQLLQESRGDYLKKKVNHQCAALDFDAGFETQRVGPLLVVDKDSATEGATRSQGFNKNHIDLAKPANRNDEVYLWVKGEIGNCVAGSRCAAAATPGPICLVGDFL